MVRLKFFSSLLVVASLGFGCTPSGGPTQGKVLYSNCVPCHGDDGGGNASIGVPAIAGQEAEYVALQLNNFKNSIRGTHASDLGGLKMFPMAKTMATDAEVKAVAAYVSRLTPVVPPPTVKGNVAAGVKLFEVCAACHKIDGSGNPALKAPSLLTTHDWYLLSQLRNFKSGARGANPKDVGGVQMAPMAMTLANEQAMRDVVAYIASLAREGSR